MIAARRPEGPDGSDRRRTPRHAPEDLAEPVYVIGSRLVNIGLGGLMLEAPIPLAPEATLHLHLVLGGARANVDARVRGCVERTRGHRRSWDVGLQFENMDATTRRQLDRVLTSRRSGRA